MNKEMFALVLGLKVLTASLIGVELNDVQLRNFSVLIWSMHEKSGRPTSEIVGAVLRVLHDDRVLMGRFLNALNEDNFAKVALATEFSTSILG